MRRYLLFIFSGALIVAGFVFSVLQHGVQYLMSRWALFFDTCAGLTRSVLDYFVHTDHLGMMIALLLVFSGVVYAFVVFVVECVQLVSFSRYLRGRVVGSLHQDVFVVADDELSAFTIGIFRPRVYVSERLVRSLSTRALDAVIAHEVHHREARHPLLKFIFHIVHALFFYIPGLSVLLRYVHIRQELLADRAAIKATSRLSLADALLTIYGQPVRSRLSAISSFSSIQERIDFVVDEREPSFFYYLQSKTLFFGGMCFVFLFGFVVMVPQHSLATEDDTTPVEVCEGVQQTLIQSLLR